MVIRVERYAWILFAVCLTGFEVWAVFSRTGPMNLTSHPVLLPLILLAFTASGLGGWWMLFMILRHEKGMFPIILAPLLIPNSFLWYYFERIKPGKRVSREQPA